MIPAASFLMGITGSIHCVAMCGAIATSCSSKISHNINYQVGRIISYSLLGLLAGYMGSSFKQISDNPYIKNIPAFMLGLFFIYWGLSTFFNKKSLITLPKSVSSLLHNVLGKFYGKKESRYRSLMIGLLTALLPCGLLYGVIISLAMFQNMFIGLIGMLFFCLGTIPALIISPTLIQKIIKPIRDQFPKATSLTLIIFGLLTISYRIYSSYGEAAAACH
jgi:sulfite exporter TauE/SafE